MLKLNVNNETSRLLAVVLGTAKSNGLTPKLEECYDPKSRKNVLNKTYPIEIDMINEINDIRGSFTDAQLERMKQDWKNKPASALTPSVKQMIMKIAYLEWVI